MIIVAEFHKHLLFKNSISYAIVLYVYLRNMENGSLRRGRRTGL